MRFILAALLGGSLAGLLGAAPAVAAPAGYRPPRHFYTPNHQPYRRPPTRLTLGASLGYYDGDLTNQISRRPGFSLGLVRPLSPHFTFGADLGYVQLEGKDYAPSRGLRFTSTSGLLTTFVRYNLLADKSLYIGPNYRPTKVQLFLQGGVGLLLNNPKASVVSAVPPYGSMPLPPEKQGGYPTLVGVLPVGGGITLKASRSLSFTLEGLFCVTGSDLLDDISQRASPDKKDDFATASLKVEYAFYKKHGKPLVHFD
ncbi:hypothetical protein [Hymenobacter sp. BT559]|uniref:hypothetical protein n=1 Tax=Hymenobacter sp. BT559 TaxID=2795729 RepID=UPI0018ECFF06|nr:hypothetical protein [Hymenobacter sp. BT559]MBJ6143217.1 hypothetical protein [Hymenobacter sp. BT559]